MIDLQTYCYIADKDDVKSIQRDGLRADGVAHLSDEWRAFYHEVYGTIPCLLLQPDTFLYQQILERKTELALFDVDPSDLALAADVVGMLDYGGRISKGHRGLEIVFMHGSIGAEALRHFVDERGAVRVDAVLNPESRACKAAIDLTATAACIGTIKATAFSLLSIGSIEQRLARLATVISNRLNPNPDQ